MTSSATALETPYFFAGPAGRLFGVRHLPDPAGAALPFVFCHPFAEEKLWAHRVSVHFARDIARLGHPVLRFDCSGSGDSDGDFSDSTLASACDDIEAAIEELKTLTGAAQVGLLGLRLGASLAARVAERRNDVERLVAWAPIIDGAAYLQELLRINLTTQLAVYREVREDRETLARRLQEGGLVNVDGYEIKRALGDQLRELTLAGPPSRFEGPAFFALIDRNAKAQPPDNMLAVQRRYRNGTLAVVQEDPFWKEIPRFYERAPNLYKATLDWLGYPS